MMTYKKISLLAAVLLAFTAYYFYSANQQEILNEPVTTLSANMVTSSSGSDLSVDYEAVDRKLAELRRQMNQPNILESDILRGWYLASESEKKYGTPDTWIFIEDGENSKWISPNALEEEDTIDDRRLCKGTAGTYISSCLKTAEAECEFVEASHCVCLEETKWKEDQGCILVSPRGTFVAINEKELAQGWYLGLPNQKKLNTPSNWKWIEDGKNSAWKKSN